MDVAELLSALRSEGLVQHEGGPVAGWRVTAMGREQHAGWLRAAIEPGDITRELGASYQGFRELDGELKAVCTAWQLQDAVRGIVNDHSDPIYDGNVLARLRRVHVNATALLAELSGALGRFAEYARRLDDAYQRVCRGDRGSLTRPLSGSYHDVWMELHEDLLLTLGLDREGSHESVESQSALGTAPCRPPL